VSAEPDRKAGDEILHVALKERGYDIHIGADLLVRAGPILAPSLNRPFMVIVTDTHVAPLYLPALSTALKADGITVGEVILPAGEATKSFHHLQSLVGDLLDLGVERNDTICALGGGVIGDLTGFAAAILRRGVNFVQIPTTLLAQVDSSIGGKTGINTAQGKNLAGAFHQPRLVLSDVSLLDTLPPREIRAGYGEVVKAALIVDACFFDWLEDQGPALIAGESTARVEAVTRAARIKTAVVMQDEREQGARALLNLGHTFGHALETATHFGDALRHGEAVAVGLALAFGLSVKMGLCPKADATRVIAHLDQTGLPSNLRDLACRDLTAERMIALMAQDKKVLNGQATFILARGIGQAFISRAVPEEVLHDFLNEALAA